MREIFVQTLKDAKSSVSYTNGELDLNEPKLEKIVYRQKETIKQKESTIEIPLVLNNTPSNTDYSHDEKKEIKSLATMYFMQLNKLEKELSLLQEVNPLFNNDMLSSSTEMVLTSINAIKLMIDNNDIQKIDVMLNKF